jgi:uncharacterized protein involved in exopolysaccharide biosynthesis
VAAWRNRQIGGLSTETELTDSSKELSALKAELVIKNALYSDTHPDILALKRKIEALKKANDEAADTVDQTQKKKDAASPQKIPAFGASEPTGIDGLELKRQSLRVELTNTRQKLATARMGEALERGQHSERLEVIEQATIPKKPDSPNRPKIFGISLVLAFMASGGFVFAAESLNPAIRRTIDLYSVIDSHLIVAIPYVTTRRELRRRRNSILSVVGIFMVLLIAGLVAMYVFLPPLDVLFAKVMTVLAR